ncbi:MAG: aldehyde dehydrogenase family protein [Flavobacteriales bacterium]|nr:aldehyde dehydrogenase family protein [Flavobacteriales bacterium]
MINEIFNSQKKHFQNELKTSSINDRLKKLRSIKNWIKNNEKLICEEIYKDFEKGEEEVLLSEIKPIIDEINHNVSQLSVWTKPKRVDTPLAFIGSKSEIHYEPKGVTLIIAPWNYPFNLCIGPLVSAIGAGCSVIIKPSEHTPNTANLISRMMSELFKEEEIAVVQGDVSVSTELLKLPFNHIFFTGSPQVGKIVMKAAAEHLTSVTLELGGRNPTIIDETANLKDAAQKIVWGKFLNSGQTCIAPNYIYVHESQAQKLKDSLIEQIEIQYSKLDTTRTKIVNSNHFGRLTDLLDKTISAGGKLLYGGEKDGKINFLSPTLISDITIDSPIFKEEIFGPILPILTYSNLEEVIETINKTEKPLALYIFSKSRKNQNYILNNTSSGTTAINETTVQFAQNHLPFGGVNNSGIGKAHGEFGFYEFSNLKSVLKQRVGFTSLKMIYPPYTNFKKKLIRFISFRL